MSVFNYRTQKEPLEALRVQVARISKCLKALRIWEVNDIGQGPNILKRRKVTPSPQMGVVGRGPWNDITGLNFEYGGERATTYDYVYVGGKKLVVPEKTTNYLKVYLDGTTTPEWVGAMPETQDSNAEVFDVTKNRIHLPGNFAGG